MSLKTNTKFFLSHVWLLKLSWFYLFYKYYNKGIIFLIITLKFIFSIFISTFCHQIFFYIVVFILQIFKHILMIIKKKVKRLGFFDLLSLKLYKCLNWEEKKKWRAYIVAIPAIVISFTYRSFFS